MKVVYFGSDVFLSCFEYFVEKHQVWRCIPITTTRTISRNMPS